MERSRAECRLAAQVVATHVEWLTAASLLLMDETDHVIGDDIDHAAAGRGRQELALHLRHMPPGVSFSLVDPGRPASSTPKAGRRPRLSESVGLTMAQTLAASGPGMSPPW